MLSYKHSFHAGNFADVLKHLVLIRLLNHLCQKDKPFCVIDTHAGAGGYSLNSANALKNREFDSGINLLWNAQNVPPEIGEYIRVVNQFNPGKNLSFYPGSPLIINSYLRRGDRLFLYELHGAEYQLLKQTLSKQRGIKLFQADGLQDCLGLLPPVERRGLVLIDPPYELKSDYEHVVSALVAMHKRFASGMYALWYPVVDRRRNQRLERALKNTGIKNMHLFELGLQTDTAEHGMTANGMIVINPPWTLAKEMHTLLPWLLQTLAQPDQGFFRAEILAEE